MVENILQELGPWIWWIGGLLLLGLELLVPGSTMVWFSVAAFAVGAIAFMVDLTWQSQLILFALISLATVFIGRKYFRYATVDGDPNLNRRADRYVGRQFVLEEAIENGEGRVRIEDTIWRVSGPDLPSGTSVKVISADGPRLRVEATD